MNLGNQAVALFVCGPDTAEIEVPYHEYMMSMKDLNIHRSLTPKPCPCLDHFLRLNVTPFRFLYSSEAVMALRTARPRCLEFNRRSRTWGPFWTTSAPSVRMSSMWEGFDM